MKAFEMVRILIKTAVLIALLGIIGVLAIPYVVYGPPLVTVANATPEDLHGVVLRVSSGCSRSFQFDLPRGSRIDLRANVCSEGSSSVEWKDPAGVTHRENANDYLEGYRGYRSFIVILPDGKLAQIFRTIPSSAATEKAE